MKTRGSFGLERFYLLAVVAGAFAVTGCGNANRTPFGGDPALPIFQAKPSDYCKPAADGSFSGGLVVNSGHEGDYDFGAGGGCIPHPIAQAWGVTFNQDAMKWGGVSELSVKMGTAPKHTTHFYEVRYVVHDVVTVKWAMQWYHTIGLGDREAPKLLWINYKRVSGTQYIPYWEGTIFLEEESPSVTGFAMRNQISATNTGPAEAGGSVTDVFNALVKAVAAPIP